MLSIPKYPEQYAQHFPATFYLLCCASQHHVKCGFFKNDLGPFRVLKRDNSAHFERIWTQFSPFRHMYAPSCTLRMHLTVILWSHLELGRGM